LTATKEALKIPFGALNRKIWTMRCVLRAASPATRESVRALELQGQRNSD